MQLHLTMKIYQTEIPHLKRNKNNKAYKLPATLLEGGPWPSNRDVVESSQRLQQINNENCHSFINIIIAVTVTKTLLCLLQLANEPNPWLLLLAYIYTRAKLFCYVNFGQP